MRGKAAGARARPGGGRGARRGRCVHGRNRGRRGRFGDDLLFQRQDQQHAPHHGFGGPQDSQHFGVDMPGDSGGLGILHQLPRPPGELLRPRPVGSDQVKQELGRELHAR